MPSNVDTMGYIVWLHWMLEAASPNYQIPKEQGASAPSGFWNLTSIPSQASSR